MDMLYYAYEKTYLSSHSIDIMRPAPGRMRFPVRGAACALPGAHGIGNAGPVAESFSRANAKPDAGTNAFPGAHANARADKNAH